MPEARRATDVFMASSLLTAFALMLIIEGLLPFIAPAAWRDTFLRLASMADGQIRFIGLSPMLAGLAMLCILL